MEMQVETTTTPLANNIEARNKELWYNYAGNWIWRATECLVELPTFEPKASYVASKLNVAIEKAVAALEGLEELGLIKRENNTFVNVNSDTRINYSNTEPLDVLRNHFNLTSQLNSKLTTEDNYNFGFFTGDKNKKAKFLRDLKMVFDKYCETEQKESYKDVYAFNFSVIRATTDENESLGGVQ